MHRIIEYIKYWTIGCVPSLQPTIPIRSAKPSHEHPPIHSPSDGLPKAEETPASLENPSALKNRLNTDDIPVPRQLPAKRLLFHTEQYNYDCQQQELDYKSEEKRHFGGENPLQICLDIKKQILRRKRARFALLRLKTK